MRPEIKMAECVINLTDKTVNLYDDATGEIKVFLPERGRLRSPIAKSSSCPKVYFIVEPERIPEISESGRELEDLAIVDDTGIGRGEVVVSFLVSAKDRRNLVRLRMPSSPYASIA